MGMREGLKSKSKAGAAISVALLVIAFAVLARAYWPEKKADLSQAYYTDDDGKSWFADSAMKVAPFDHNGKPAVVAHVYSYADGKKSFCAYVAKFTPEAQKKLEAALAAARKAGQPPESVGLFRDPSFIKTGVMVKAIGSDQWLQYGDPKSQRIFTIHAPDGSEVDELFAY